MKKPCCKCKDMAVWYYVPGEEQDNDYYCDNCVRRGCSCNVGLDGSESLDGQGRRYPCCEYDWNEDGFDE